MDGKSFGQMERITYINIQKRKGDFMLYIIILLALMMIFYLWGHLLSVIFRIKHDVVSEWIIGIFLYFGLFQCIYFPAVMTHQSLQMLCIAWCIVATVITLIGIVCSVREIESFRAFRVRALEPNLWFIYLGCGFMFCILLYKAVTAHDVGWDAAAYYGSVAESIKTNTLFQYDGESGNYMEGINLHFAISGFYMHSAVVCKVFSLHVLLFQNVVVRTILIFSNCLLMYQISGGILKEKNNRIYALLVYMAMCMIINSDRMPEYFMLMRGGETKAYCGAMVYPAIVWLLINIFFNAESKKWWGYLLVVAFASVPISASSLVGVPIVIGAVTLVLAIYNKCVRYLLYGGICCMPNVIWGGIYLLNMRGYIG